MSKAGIHSVKFLLAGVGGDINNILHVGENEQGKEPVLFLVSDANRRFHTHFHLKFWFPWPFCTSTVHLFAKTMSPDIP